MRFVRYGEPGQERPAIIDAGDRLRDISAIVPDIDGAALSGPAWSTLAALDPDALPDLGPASEHRLGPCVGRTGKIICMGLNEGTHSQEIGTDHSAGPTFFFKPVSAITGAGDDVLYPRIGREMDWEAELALVIGKTCKHVPEDEADSVVAGYCILNDLSDRHWQRDAKGKLNHVSTAKGFDTFAPIGPYLVTADEVGDANALDVRLWVNGELRQQFNTRDYIFNTRKAIAYCSQFMTLQAGDVISMGSGPGNGIYWGFFLKAGDRVRTEIAPLGAQDFLIREEV